MKQLRNLYFFLALFISFSFFSLSVYSQEKNLRSSRLLGEAEFHFDTFYKIVDCGNGVPQFFITAFNESGKDLNISFNISLKDKKSGAIQEINVPFFAINKFELFAPKCSDKKYDFLKYNMNSQINYNDMDVTIKFTTKGRRY